MRRRKLFCMTIAMIAGICLMQGMRTSILPILFAAAAAAIASSSKEKSDSNRGIGLLLLLCMLAGGGMLYFSDLNARQDNLYHCLNRETTVEAKVIGIEQKEKDSYRIRCKTDSGEKLLCSYYQPLEQYPELMGCRIRFRAEIQNPKSGGNPHTFDYALYLKSEGIRYIAVLSEFEIVARPKGFITLCSHWIFTQREAMLRQLKLSETGRGLVRGILFGDTEGLDEEIYDAFRKNSTAHVLAVSGLHVGMLYGVYQKLIQRKRNPLLTILFVCILLLYGAATLWSVSVTRAVILILLTLGAELFARRYDMTTALAAAALAAIVSNPYVVFGAGFQMSFLAVLCISFFTPVLKKYLPDSLAVMASVQLGLLPYMAYTFNSVSLSGFFCNPPVVFLVSFLVPLGIAGFLLYLATGIILPGFARIIEGLGALTIKANDAFSAGGLLVWDVASPPLWLLVAGYLLIFFLASEYFFVIKHRKTWNELKLPAVIIITALIVSATFGSSPFDRASMIFVDVGQGDCLHIRGKEKKNILIDGGGNIRYNVGEKMLKPYLLKNGAGKLDIAATTHLHTDHYLGLTQLSACYPVEKLITVGSAGDRIILGEHQWIEILWPKDRNPDTEDENLNSLIFKVHMDGVTALVTGDITEEGEKLLLQEYGRSGVLRADILKIAHHGSRYSSCDAFIKAVSPSVAVISVGKNNYGHPHNIVLEKLEKHGIMVYRTDLDGAVGIINERGNFSVCTKNPKNTALKYFPKI